MNAAWIALVLLLSSMPEIAAAAPRASCARLAVDADAAALPRATRQIIKQLTARKYDESVARRIAVQRPDVATRILAGGKDTKPMTLYRGLDVSLTKYNPRRRDGIGAHNNSQGQVWVSPKFALAQTYTGDRGILIEYQVPAFLYTKDGGNDAGTIGRDDMPDDAVFISRVGQLTKSWMQRSADGQASEGWRWAYDWYQYDDAFVSGKPIKANKSDAESDVRDVSGKVVKK